MPLVRVEVRNEYGLGMPELYTETHSEDPKAVLDGVAVAGLVGILRQLGDLSEFAAEVFHGIQEQVLITSSRSHKLGERVYNIEAALPRLERAILAQRSHLHFAYTSGSHWHARRRIEQNHFIYGDLPRCIMDCYEDCRDPPRLHKLDKFDTGGRGSCFKRYSDPTYFKRASAGPYGTHLQSVPREKKARRSKKKRSLLRHRDMTRDAPIFTHGSGMDFASRNSNGKGSPSLDVSTIHVAPKSGTEPEMGDHLISFDSRNGSGYIECIFRPSYSTQSEENEAKELFSDSKVQQNAYLDSASLHENSGVPDENVENSNLQENNGPRSSLVSWDEKLEIIESTGQVIDTTEISCTTDKLDTEENEDWSSRVDLIDFDFHDERLAISIINGDQPDEIESEMDYHIDSLNIIESESETDVCCQTKRELKQYSSVNNEDLEGKLEENNLDDSSMNFESHIPEPTYSTKDMCSPIPKQISHESHVKAHSFSNNETSMDKSKSDLLENSDQATSLQIAGTSLISSTSTDYFNSEGGEIHGTNLGTVASNGIFSSSREPNSQPPSSKQILRTHESPKSPSSTSGALTTLTDPVMLWTNGGLFGLAPSKPPDFGLPPTVGPESVAESKDDLIQHSSQKNAMEGDGHVAGADMVGNGSKFESSSRYPDSNISNHAQDHDCSASNTMTPAIDGLVAKDDPIKSIKENGMGSSRIFELSNRLLVNGFRRQMSLVGDEKLASSMRSDVPEKPNIHTGCHAAMGKPFGEQFGSGSPLKSPSSPPLQHMRISFQPIDGFENSKLKLKFPDENDCHENSIGMFPSFQLVPEPAISLHESGSDSDDDTFCRSSLYASDDCCSHHSESNSEQWDSGDSPRIKDHELVDAFGRISSTESVSSSLVNGITFPDPGNCGRQSQITVDGDEPYHSGSVLEIPNFDSIRTSLNQISSNSDGRHVPVSCFPKEPTPSPPPLPPSELRGFKPHPDVTIDKKDTLSQSWTYALDQTLPEATVPQQPKPDPLKPDHFVETVDRTPTHKPLDKQNLDVQNESNRTTCVKVADEKEDFLQQIRTESLNLRRTLTARPTSTADGSTDVKVIAILEKANAICQAVGSDDGEDDNWSET